MDFQQTKDYLMNTEQGRFLFNLSVLLLAVTAASVSAWIFWFRHRWGTAGNLGGVIHSLIRNGEHLEAGEMMLSAENYEGALECFAKIRYYRRQADIYLKLGNFQKAALMYERDLDFCSAADVYIADGKMKAIYDLAERAPNKAELAAYLAQTGQEAMAADIFMHARSYREAANLYAKLNDPGKAADALEKKLRFSPPKTLDEELGITRDLGQLYRALNKPEQASALLEKAAVIEAEIKRQQQAAERGPVSPLVVRSGSGEEILRASAISRTSGMSGVSGLSHMSGFNANRSSSAADKSRSSSSRRSGAVPANDAEIKKMIDAGQVDAAIDAYIRLERFREAGVLAEDRGDYEYAGELFARAEDYERAGRCYEKVGNLKGALQCFEAISNTDKVIEIAHKLKEWVKLGQILLNMNRLPEAVSAFQKIEKNNPEYPTALKMLAKAYYSMENFSIARALFQEYEHNYAANKSERLESMFYKAVSAGKEEKYEEAIKEFEDLMKSNYKKNEVAKHLSELKSSLEINRTKVPVTGGKPATVRYVREGEIGRGGMAVVYKAKDSVLGRTVALKVLLDNFKKNSQAVEIFLREAKATAILKHPNIVTVYDAGSEGEDFYIAMEFIEGTTLKSILKKRRLSIDEVIRFCIQLSNGLHYAHERRIVHRDMTTNNLMLDETGTLKIMDFGLVKILEKVQAEQSLIGGTPSYMAPEQILGKAVDRRADIYSFGICLFEMLVGKVPFSGGDASYHHLHSPPPDVRSLQAQAPEFLCNIVAKCLQKKREDRFGSLAEIIEILEKHAAAA